MDKNQVNGIIEEIRLQGFDSIFLDHDEFQGIKSGENWEKRLYSEIKRFHAILNFFLPTGSIPNGVLQSIHKQKP